MLSGALLVIFFFNSFGLSFGQSRTAKRRKCAKPSLEDRSVLFDFADALLQPQLFLVVLVKRALANGSAVGKQTLGKGMVFTFNPFVVATPH